VTNISKLIVIAHRGLLEGPAKNLENNPENIIFNIKNYPNLFNEVDINIVKDAIYTGHDKPTYKIDLEFILNNKTNLILHIKKLDYDSAYTIDTLLELYESCHCFCHEEDNFTITNKGLIWSHPKMGINKNTVCVMPEKVMSISSEAFIKNLNLLKGVCTDFPLEIMKIINKNKINSLI
tara:strand:- start:1099 stop:1635 length:537 start_codon:yes stop_codon:yes gene_type:complete